MPDQPPKNYDEMMAKINSRKRSPLTRKRRKLPAFFVFLNIFIIAIMAFHYYRNVPERQYFTTLLSYSGVQYRFSITRDEATQKLSYSLTAKNSADALVRVAFRDPVATVSVRHEDTVVSTVKLGEKIRELTLKPGDSKVFVESTGVGAFVDFTNANRELITPKRRTFLSSEKRHIPLSAEVRLETREPVATVLDFKYTVD